MSQLRLKAAKGMFWTALQRYVTMSVQFVSGIILARLLSPFDYGCIGMLSIFMALAEVFINGGFGSALIQAKTPTKEDYSTVFYWNMGMAVLMYGILFLCAPLISRFYKIPLLCPVLRVQGFVLFAYAFNIVQRNQLKKVLNFKAIAIVTIGTAILSLGTTIYLAYKGFGVWALVTQNLISAIIPSIVFWFYLRWRPILVFSWASFHKLFGFGFYVFLTHVVNEFCTKLSGLLIGKLYTADTMGYYSKAMSTEKMASQTISSVMIQVTFPLYSSVQNDLKAMGNMVKRLTSMVAFVTFPLMFVLILLAKPIFLLLYSEKWLFSIPYFQILCIMGLSSCLQSINLQTISAIGRSKTMFIWTIVKRTSGLLFMVGGLYFWGIYGLLWGTVISDWFAYFVNIGLVSKYIGYKWYNQLRDLMPIALVSMIAAAAAYIIGKMSGLGLYPDALLKLIIVAGVYLGWIILFKPECFRYCKSFLCELIARKKHRK